MSPRYGDSMSVKNVLGNLNLQASIFSYIILFCYLLKTEEHNTNIQTALSDAMCTTSSLEKTVCL